MHGNPWTSVAELNVLGTVAASGPPPTLAQVTVNPTIVVGGPQRTGYRHPEWTSARGWSGVALGSTDSSATGTGQRDGSGQRLERHLPDYDDGGWERDLG